MEEFEIKPRDFEIQLVVGESSICWSSADNQILPYTDCCNFLGPLHTHEDDERLCSSNSNNEQQHIIVCCSEVDIIALKYLNTSIFGPLKTKIISSLHSWLPAVVLNYVDVVWQTKNLTVDEVKTKGYRINSYFEPTFLFKLSQYIGVNPQTNSIYYNYYCSYIVDESYYPSYIQELNDNNINLTLYMETRRRSSSRGRSPSQSSGSASGGQRRRSRSRSRSSSRSRAPKNKSNAKKRNRSRSPKPKKPRNNSGKRRNGRRRRSKSR